MTLPGQLNPGQKSPGEMGAAIGGNLLKGFQGYQDTTALDQILQQAAESNDPNAKQNMMQSILARISPEKQPMAMKVLENKMASIQQQKTQSEMFKIADTIDTNNPNSPTHKIIADVYRSDIPVDQKNKLIKSISNTLPFKFEQQARLKQDSIVKNYNALIKETNLELNRISDAGGDENEIKRLETRRTKLQKERDQVLDFKSLKEEEGKEKIGKSKKVIFDQNIKKHKEEALMLFKKFKNKKRVEKVLRKKYEL